MKYRTLREICQKLKSAIIVRKLPFTLFVLNPQDAAGIRGLFLSARMDKSTQLLIGSGKLKGMAVAANRERRAMTNRAK